MNWNAFSILVRLPCAVVLNSFATYESPRFSADSWNNDGNGDLRALAVAA